VAQRAAARLIGFSLELGGKNPAIVLASADPAKAAEIIVAGCFGNAGQLCVSISRVYVPNSMKAAFEKKLVDAVAMLKVGRSNDFNFDIGSLTSAAQLARVERYVNDAKQKGAQILIGGQSLPELGPYFFSPTVISNIGDDVLLKREEVFGPVLSVYGYEDIDEAVDAANDSEFGLNSSVIGNRNDAIKIAARINSGSVNINEGYRASFASFGAPMGGTKRSGFGRRNGIGGLLRFTEAKAVGIARSVAGIGLPNTAKQWSRMVPLMRTLAKVLRRLP
jgi:succinate-semialdehyde dehydrogenase/glutarate-semialdehyde dehydrogenase